MRKKIAVVFVAILLMAGAIALRVFLSGPGEPGGPEIALPRVSAGDEYVLIKMENPRIFKDKLIRLAELLPDLAEDLDVSEFDIDDALDALAWYSDAAKPLESLLDSARGISALAVPSGSASLADSADSVEIFVSLYADGGVFSKWLLEGDGAEYSPVRWEVANTGGRDEAWTLETGLPGLDLLYVLKRPEAGLDLIIISDSEAGVRRMLSARGSARDRLVVKRYNAGPDYLQLKMKVPLIGRAGTATGVSEVAWVEDDASAHLQIYSDAYSSMTSRSVPKSGIEGNLPLMGSGDLAMVMALDIPFVCFGAFPTAQDPVDTFLSEVGGDLPAAQIKDIKTILEQGRISAVLVIDEEKDEPNTAYLVMESKASEQMDRLFALASLFLKSPVEIPGWNSSYAASIGDISVVAAHREGALLLGIGRAEDFGQKPYVPVDIGDFAAPHDLVNFVARSSLLDAGESNLGRLARFQVARLGFPESLAGYLDLQSIEAIQFRIMTPEYANLGIYWDR
ncbi:MAG: hypothetical protein LBT08_07690 [Synergistaceae bacterium]|nr:hypothetical protein [Synergistaceae bacterium]